MWGKRKGREKTRERKKTMDEEGERKICGSFAAKICGSGDFGRGKGTRTLRFN